MEIKQLLSIIAIVITTFACTKAPALLEDPIVETPIDEAPIDTTVVVNPPPPPPPPPPPSVYLPASAFAADKGLYYAIRGNATNYGLEYDLDNYQLMILNDTLRLGNMKLLPISATEAHILPFRTTVTKWTNMGYSYQADARGTGVIAVNGGNLSATIQKVAIDNSSSSNYSVTYFNGIPSALPLTRSDYTGKYAGFSTNASGYGNTITVTIEPLAGTTDGVWLKEINQNAYINGAGKLVIPESAADSSLYGPTARYLAIETGLSGKLLQFGQQRVYGSMSPSPSDYKAFVLFKE
jgi:hypothetical protein